MAKYVEPSGYFSPEMRKILKEGEKSAKKPASKPASKSAPKKPSKK